MVVRIGLHVKDQFLKFPFHKNSKIVLGTELIMNINNNIKKKTVKVLKSRFTKYISS